MNSFKLCLRIKKRHSCTAFPDVLVFCSESCYWKNVINAQLVSINIIPLYSNAPSRFPFSSPPETNKLATSVHSGFKWEFNKRWLTMTTTALRTMSPLLSGYRFLPALLRSRPPDSDHSPTYNQPHVKHLDICILCTITETHRNARTCIHTDAL